MSKAHDHEPSHPSTPPPPPPSSFESASRIVPPSSSAQTKAQRVWAELAGVPDVQTASAAERAADEAMVAQLVALPTLVPMPAGMKESVWLALKAEVAKSPVEVAATDEAPISAAGPVGTIGRLLRISPYFHVAAAVLFVAAIFAVEAWRSPEISAPVPSSLTGRILAASDDVRLIMASQPSDPIAEHRAAVGMPVRADMELVVGAEGHAALDLGASGIVLVHRGTRLQIPATDRMNLREGAIALVGYEPVVVQSPHGEIRVAPEIDAEAPPGSPSAAVVAIHCRVERWVMKTDATAADERVSLDAQMVPLEKAIRHIREISGMPLIVADDVPAQPLNTPVSLVVYAARRDELPLMLGPVVEGLACELRRETTADGKARYVIRYRPDAGPTEARHPAWLTVNVQAGRVSVQNAAHATATIYPTSERPTPLALHIFDDGRPIPTSAAGAPSWVGEVTAAMAPLDSRLRVLVTPHRDWPAPPEAVVLTPIPSELRELRLVVYLPHAGRANTPAVLVRPLFQPGEGLKMLREGDRLHGWTVDRISPEGMRLSDATGRHTFVAVEKN